MDDEDLPGSADRIAAERLIAKNARALARVTDPRQRRQRAYALLARNGLRPGDVPGGGGDRWSDAAATMPSA